MKKVQWKRLTAWLVVLAMTVIGFGMVAVGEDIPSALIGDIGEEDPPVIEDPPEYVDPPAEVEPPVEVDPPAKVGPTTEVEPPISNANENSGETPPVVEQAPSEPLEKPPVAYNIRFVYFDGTEERSFSVQVLDTEIIENPAFVPALEGHAFAYWYDVSEGTAMFAFGNTPTKDLTLKAYFIEVDAGENPEDGRNDSDLPGDKEQKNDKPAENLGAVDIDEGDDVDELEIFIILDEEVPLAGPQPSVSVTSDAGEFVEHGDVITLTAQTTGLEGLAYTVTWRYFDGTAWHVAETDAGLVCRYTVNEENFDWTWEIEITILQNEEPVQETDEAVVL